MVNGAEISLVMQKVLLFVESPLQLLCAYQAIDTFQFKKLDVNVVIRLTKRGENDNHMLKLADDLGIDFQVITLRPNRLKFDILRSSFKLSGILIKRYDIVFFGSYFSGLLNVLKRLLRFDAIYYLDDGAATFRVQKKLSEASRPANLFTFLPIKALDNQTVIFHQFEALKERFSLSSFQKKGKYFVGQPVQIMRGISETQYMKYLTKISEEEPIFYIPHRVEEKAFLEKLENNPNIRVLYLETNIELYFLNNGVIPETVYSVYSTALFTMSNLFDGTRFFACELTKYTDVAMRELYQAMRSQGITILTAEALDK